MTLRHYKVFFLLVFLGAAACSEKDVFDDKKYVAGWDVPSAPVKLIIETDTVLDLVFGEQAAILARVMYTNNTPAPDRPVRFSILGNAQGSSLLFGDSTTGSDGRLANPLKAGPSRAAFKVRVETTQSNGDQLFELIDVEVDGIVKGRIKATFGYSDPLPLQRITARLHQGPLNCATIDFTRLPPVVQTQETTGVTRPAVFNRLPENKVYTVTVEGKGPTGNTVVVGCKIAPPVIGRGLVTVDIPLTLKQLEVDGVYDFSTNLFLSDILPPPGGEILQRIENYLVHPAEAMSEDIIGALAQQANMPPALFEGIFVAAWSVYASTLPPEVQVDYTVAGALDYLVFDRMPLEVNQSFNILGDVSGLLNHLMVGGQMEIKTYNEEDGTITGEWGWSDFMFRWGFGEDCDPRNTCCGRRVYSGVEMGLEPIGSSFTGTVLPHERAVDEAIVQYPQFDFTMDQHRLALQYGNLILFIVNEFVLPAAIGENSLPCALEKLMGCEEGGEFNCNGQNVGVCGCDRAGVWLADIAGMSPSLGRTACEMGLTAAEMGIINGMNRLNYSGPENGNLSIEAEGLLSDVNQDMKGDTIEADTVGLFYFGESAQTTFSGDMKAELGLVSCANEDLCGEGSSCGLKQDVLNACAPNQVCISSVGGRIGGARCTVDAHCKSGRCMKNRTCFAACERDTDCPGDLTCGVDAYEVELAEDIVATVTACGQNP